MVPRSWSLSYLPISISQHATSSWNLTETMTADMNGAASVRQSVQGFTAFDELEGLLELVPEVQVTQAVEGLEEKATQQ